jgi:hypothetical protein
MVNGTPAHLGRTGLENGQGAGETGGHQLPGEVETEKGQETALGGGKNCS